MLRVAEHRNLPASTTPTDGLETNGHPFFGGARPAPNVHGVSQHSSPSSVANAGNYLPHNASPRLHLKSFQKQRAKTLLCHVCRRNDAKLECTPIWSLVYRLGPARLFSMQPGRNHIEHSTLRRDSPAGTVREQEPPSRRPGWCNTWRAAEQGSGCHPG